MHFFDEFSRELAQAPTRRDALRVIGNLMFGSLAVSVGAGNLWAAKAKPGDVGSAPCVGLQRIVQLLVGDPDPQKYPKQADYVKAATTRTTLAQQAGIITKKCEDCIVSQFSGRISVARQLPCGIGGVPTVSCGSLGVTSEQVEAAVYIALGLAPDAWSDPNQFILLLQSTEQILGCTLRGPNTNALGVPEASLEACAEQGVQYCGPLTSKENEELRQLPVSPCLNEECCKHDKDYESACVPRECNFTLQPRNRDQGLIDVCSGPCRLTLNLATQLVCAALACLSGIPRVVNAQTSGL